MIKYTFRELFSKVNIVSVWEILLKINEYDRDIAKFEEDINTKLGIMLNYIWFEISETKPLGRNFPSSS